MDEAMHRQVLDAVAAEIAVIDREGRILATNAEWQRFALANGGCGTAPAPGTGVGANYLDACAAGGDGGLAARDGIQAVLRGERDDFTLDYPCHTPERQRWFTMAVRPLGRPAQQPAAGAVITHTEVTRIKAAEEELRIAAIAFDNQQGMLVLDAQRNILRVNQAFTRITGYTPEEVQGQRSGMARSPRHDDAFYEEVWRQVREQGAWHGLAWNRRKDGEDYLSQTSITAVHDSDGRLTHFVGNFSDVTSQELREQERLRREAEHRSALVREVHHRIKNNLQGVIGILRDFGNDQPALREPITQVVAKVQSIAVIHGLQGRAMPDQVRVCELTSAVAESVAALWRSAVEVDIPPAWQPCVVSRDEAVPLALVLNELMINAVKHGDDAQGPVRVTLRKNAVPCSLRISIRNSGAWRAQPSGRQVGLELVRALLPRDGARLSREDGHGHVDTLLDLGVPVVSMEQVT